MRVSSALRSLGAADEGGVLVLVALSLPVLLIAAAFAIDVGNWFVHKGHLQMQADASALAAAQEFKLPCSDAPILAKAADYGGGAFNAQIGGTPASRVHLLVNSRTYFGQAPADDTVAAPPCSASMVDVKLTETDLPWFFDLLPGAAIPKVPFINAHARVSINQIDSSAGALPVGVPDVNPKSARAWFINESTHAVLGSTPLSKVGTSNGLVVWDNAAAPLPVTFASTAKDVGVVVALGGSTSTTCGDPLVSCYDAGAAVSGGLPATGILHIQGWSRAPTVTATATPELRSAPLAAGTCTNPDFVADASCAFRVTAAVDFGTTPTIAGATLTAVAGGTKYPMTYSATTATWSTTASAIPIAPGGSPLSVDLAWERSAGTVAGSTCTTKNNNPCKGTFAGVQRAFSGSDARSGPIQQAQVLRDGVTPVDSVERCSSAQTSCTQNMVVRIGVKGNLKNAADKNDPIVPLRVVGGSQNQALDCDPTKSKLKDELATGCTPTYKINTGTSCPGSVSALWATAQPWQCVGVQTGSATNQVPAGLNLRILGAEKPATCTAPNHWSSFPNLDPHDPRIIQVLLTPFGTFSGSGSTTVPVSDFATFYVTGWTGQGQGFANPCQGNGDDPVPNNDAGYIVGHFIKYIETLNPGGGTTACDVNAFGACVATMTR
jgi:hypothetical protein